MSRALAFTAVVALAVTAAPAPAHAALPALAVGATTSANDTVGSGNTCAGFLDERANLGNLGIRRVFTPAGPGSPGVTANGTGGDREIRDWIVPPAYADAYGLDLYWQASTRGSEPDDPVSVGSDPRMIRWYGAFAGRGRPLTLPEWGIDDDQGIRASRGPAIRASRAWLTARDFRVISYWQMDNWYLGAGPVPPGAYPDPDGVAAYQELVAAAAP